MPAAVVEYSGWKEGYRCGYCASERGKVSAGKRGEEVVVVVVVGRCPGSCGGSRGPGMRGRPH